jgi:hypothetical protein
MIPFLPLLRSRFAGYVVGAILAGLVAGYFSLQLAAAERETARTKAEMADLLAGYSEASRLRQEHALRLVQEARAEEIAAADARVQAEREAADRLREAAREATRQAGEWRARLREAQAQDASCAAWWAEPIRCPTD